MSLPASPRLRKILLAYTVNELGTWLGYVALTLAVYQHTHSTIAVAGLLVSSRFLPALLVPALVARVEASKRRGELSVLYIFEGFLALMLANLLDHFWLPIILALMALDGTASLAARSLLRAAAARIASESSPEDPDGEQNHSEPAREQAQRAANAALNIGFTASVAAGPALGGLVVATLGGPQALYLDAVSFGFCGLMLFELRPHIEEVENTTVRLRLAATLHFLGSAPKLRAILLTQAIAMVFFASIVPVEVVYATTSVHAGDEGYGFLLGAWGIGMVIGGIVFARSTRRPLRLLLAGGALAVGLSYLGIAGAPNIYVACAVAVLGGLGNGMEWPAAISAVQTLTPHQLHGRMMATIESIGAFCPALGFLLGGVATAVISPRGAFWLAGVVATASTYVFARIARSGLSGSQPEPEPAPPLEKQMASSTST